MWLARHGETEWTLSRQHTGRTDLPLTARGERAARDDLAPRLAGVAFDLVLTSPLRRARDTARLAGFGDALTDERLMEVDYGDYDGLTTAEIRRDRPGWDLWTDGCPGGESVEDAGERLDAFLAERVPRSGRVLVFGHGHALRILAARRLGLPAREGRTLLLPPLGLGVLGAEHGRPAVVRWGP
jgi:probable phosphoglycerate mutase